MPTVIDSVPYDMVDVYEYITCMCVLAFLWCVIADIFMNLFAVFQSRTQFFNQFYQFCHGFISGQIPH